MVQYGQDDIAQMIKDAAKELLSHKRFRRRNEGPMLYREPLPHTPQ